MQKDYPRPTTPSSAEIADAIFDAERDIDPSLKVVADGLLAATADPRLPDHLRLFMLGLHKAQEAARTRHVHHMVRISSGVDEVFADEKAYTKDVLTGATNRYGLFVDFARIVNRGVSKDSQLTAVAMIDLDGFKQANDGLGHANGDKVLITVASKLRAITRPDDIVARLGGDEFVVVLDDLSEKDAKEKINELYSSITFDARSDENEIYPINGSFGIRMVTPDELLSMTLEDFLDDADKAMYHAKDIDLDKPKITYYSNELFAKNIDM